MSNYDKLQVMTQEGPVLGAMDGDIFVFKGIPYAAPPVDTLRWRPPQPVQHWSEPLEAKEHGSSSHQDWELCADIGGGDPNPLHEDCLYLNVWTPQLNTKAAPLPVMVWIHGGGYVIGAGGLPVYIGAPLNKRGAIVVSVNYRLGHLGFFAHPALDQEYPPGEVVNNFALLDQIAALEWVQRNIALFGGDPGNVTIFGQSAGGRSVLSLFTSPLATRLFHKGVAQSVYGLPDTTREDALKRGEAFAAYHELKESDPAEIAIALRALDASGFWKIESKEARLGGPVPISGDSVLPTPILDVFEKGEQAKLPLIIGNTSDDSSVLADFGFGPADVIDALHKAEKYEAVKLLYPGLDDNELGRQVGRDLLFTTMSHLIAEKHRAAGAASWRYYFDYVAEEIRPNFPNGARHGDEIPYVMDTGSIAPPTNAYFSAQDQAFAQNVGDYWLQFSRSASNASASIAGVVAWPKHNGVPIVGLRNNQTMGFGKDSGNTIALEENFMWLRVRIFEPILKDLAEMIPKQAGRIHSYQQT
ncbi:carboxylesterase/lipase family protein [Dyella tabacisoli]|uniref:Carboxylic ester hydrolase n=2 Tax=Dyella tabacisoli TaxID=2282381 RepID=A0A369UUR5_9GAMM|nr:carboxylesterase family protein [Dyella tabacisoli]RDD82089.1 carboxylesterase/lipase family protein [Dyella tabacisoli]